MSKPIEWANYCHSCGRNQAEARERNKCLACGSEWVRLGTGMKMSDQNKLRNALLVFLLDPFIRAFLNRYDPKSVEQAEAALGYRVPTPDPETFDSSDDLYPAENEK